MTHGQSPRIDEPLLWMMTIFGQSRGPTGPVVWINNPIGLDLEGKVGNQKSRGLVTPSSADERVLEKVLGEKGYVGTNIDL